RVMARMGKEAPQKLVHPRSGPYPSQLFGSRRFRLALSLIADPCFSMTEAAAISRDQVRAPILGRWWQLSLGIICLSMIGNLQYGWTLFVNPIHDRHGWGLPAIQVAFTVFVLVETWLVPIEGYLVDKFGPKVVGVVAGVLVALAWAINSI